jgi:hypothetical protein
VPEMPVRVKYNKRDDDDDDDDVWQEGKISQSVMIYNTALQQ